MVRSYKPFTTLYVDIYLNVYSIQYIHNGSRDDAFSEVFFFYSSKIFEMAIFQILRGKNIHSILLSSKRRNVDFRIQNPAFKLGF